MCNPEREKGVKGMVSKCSDVSVRIAMSSYPLVHSRLKYIKQSTINLLGRNEGRSKVRRSAVVSNGKMRKG